MCQNYLNDFTYTFSKQLSCFYFNARSFRNKWDVILSNIETFKSYPDIIVATETWLCDNETNFYKIPGYSSFFNCRNDRQGGGTAVYVKHNFQPTLKFSFSDYNIQVIEIKLNPTESCNIICIYRPEGNVDQFIVKLENLLVELKSEKNIIFGDFNINLINHDSCFNYSSAMLSHGYMLLNNQFPTRLNNLIDHIWTNKTDDKYWVTTFDGIDNISDHNSLMLEIENQIHVENENNPIIKKINQSQLLLGFKEYIINYDNSTPNETPTFLIDTFNKVLEKCTYQKHINETQKKICPWFNKELDELIKKRNYWHNLHKLFPSSKLYNDLFIRFRNDVTLLRRKLKKTYFSSELQKVGNNAKSMWTVLNKVIGYSKNNNDNVCSSLKIDETIMYDKVVISNKFCKYFSTIGKELAKNFQESTDFTFSKINNVSNLYFFPTDNFEIEKIILNLKPNLTSFIYKNCLDNLLPIIVKFVNYSLETGTVPSELKTARVIPIFKNNGDNKLISNYRPISILPTLSKILETVVKSRLLSFLSKISFFNKKQYGFIKNSNTEIAFVDLVIKLQKTLDSGKKASGIFLDITKAFDSVDCCILLKKLEKIGVRGIALKWFSEYLNNRKMFVDINNVHSQEMFVDFGVPQGSVLGPYLFLIYINDICECELNGDLLLYADDTNIFYTADSNQQLSILMQDDLKVLEKWFRANRLTVNADKTNFILFSKLSEIQPNDLSNLNFFKSQITQVQTVKFLGLWLTSNLDWTQHISAINIKICKFIGIFYRIRNVINEKCKRTLYYSFVHSHLTNYIVLWGYSSDNRLQGMKILQNRIIKVLFNIPYRTHTPNVYIQTNILKLDYQLRYSSALLIQKILKQKIHSNTLVLLNSDIHTYDTRNCNKPFITHNSTTTFGTKSFLSKSLKYYNTLSDEIRGIVIIKKFKLKLYQHVFGEILLN